MARLRATRSRIRSFLAKPSPVDWLLAAAVTLAAELEVVIKLPHLSPGQQPSAVGALALLGLAWWRRQPLVPSVLLAGSAVVEVATGARMPMGVPQLALFLATYSLGAYAGNRALGVGALLPAATAVAIDGLLPTPLFPLVGALFWYVVFVTGIPILLGRLVRARTRLVTRLQEQRGALLAEREARATEAVTAERQRISRQLHSVVVHSVASLIADVAVAEADSGENGFAAVVRIESVARNALSEMRRLLGALRAQGAERQPAPDGPSGTPVLTVSIAPEPNGVRVRRHLAALGRAPWPVLLAALTLVWFEAGIQSSAPSHGSRLLIDVSLLGIAAPIAWSRTHPLMAAATCLLAVAAISRWLIPIPISGLDSAMLAVYLPFSVAAFSDRRGALVGLAICCVGFIGAYGFQAPLLPILAGAWLAGRLLGDRTRLVAELEATNWTLAAERDRRAHQLMLEERLRVARDLHDVIGHTLMVLVLQTGAARSNWASDRVRAARAIVSLANVAREALPELLASLLALDDSSSPRPPIPGLADIDALVAQARAAGIRVELRKETLPAELNPELELTAYRVVQEALTNVMKHAPRSATHVRIQARDERLQVEVVNSGPLPPRLGRGSTGGQGLSGMAQRVAAGGGEFSWGRDALGGFAVQARLPIAT
jgi:signal transduction histidine kinase